MSLIMYNKTFLSLDENLRVKKGGKEKTGETSLPATRVSLAFRALLCAKNEAPEEEVFFFK